MRSPDKQIKKASSLEIYTHVLPSLHREATARVDSLLFPSEQSKNDD